MKHTLRAEKRVILGKKSEQVRKDGMIPAVVYGKGVANQSLSVLGSEFEKLYRVAGESTLLELAVGGDKGIPVLIQDVQRDAMTDKVIHIDFHQVSMTDKMTASIPLKFTGEAKAVKELGGTLVKNLDEVTVRCLPQDLVSELVVDLSVLATFEDSIELKDVVLPKGMELIGQADLIVATVMPPMTEEEIKKLDEASAATDVSKIEKVETKKKEEPAE